MKLRRAGKSFPRQLTTGTESSVFCLVMYRELSGHYHGGQRGEQELEKSGKRPKLEPYFKLFSFLLHDYLLCPQMSVKSGHGQMYLSGCC